MGLDYELDPLEQLISDQFNSSPILAGIFLYFEWKKEPQGSPYCNVVPIGGSNVYTMPGARPVRAVQGRVVKQFSVFSTDRLNLMANILPEISRLFDAVPNLAMKNNNWCNSIFMEYPWRTTYEMDTVSTLDVNCWHANTRIVFQVENLAGSF